MSSITPAVVADPTSPPAVSGTRSGSRSFVGTLAAYTVYKLVVSEQARRNAILFLLGVIVIIVLNALERWLLW